MTKTIYSLDISSLDIAGVDIGGPDMSISKWIAYHPKIVIAIWMLILVLVTPLAIMLDQVLTYEETAFLPENTESAKVNKILEEKFGENATMKTKGNEVVLLITNIDAGSASARDAYEEFKDKVEGKYVISVDSYYDQLDMINEIARNVSERFGGILVNSTYMMLNTSDMLADRYSMLIENTTRMYNSTRMLYMMIENTSAQYNMLVTQLNETKQRIGMLKQAVVGIDEAAYTAKTNLEQLYTGMHNVSIMLNQSVSLLQLVNGVYTRTFYDTLRTYYYLSTYTQAYQAGNLTDIDIGIVIQYTNQSIAGPVDPMIVVAVFQSTYPIVGNNTWMMNDIILYNISCSIAGQAIDTMLPDDPMVRGYVEVIVQPYTGTYLSLLQGIEDNYNKTLLTILSTNDPSTGQALLLNRVTELSTSTVENLGPVLEQLYQQSASNKGFPLPPEAVSLLANKTIELALGRVNETVDEAAIELFYSMMPPNMSWVPIELLHSIYYNGVTPDIIWSIIIEQFPSQASFEIPGEYVEVLVNAVRQADPYCSGVLVSNESLVKQVVVNIAVELMPSNATSHMPINPRDTVLMIYDVSYNDIPSVAKQLLKEGMEAFLSNASEIPMPPQMLSRIIDVILDHLRPGENVNATQVLIDVYREAFNLTQPEMLRIALSSLNKSLDDVIREDVNPLFKNMTLTYMKEFMGNETIYEEMKDTVERILDYIISSYPDYSGLHNYTASLLIDRFNEEYSRHAGIFRDAIDIKSIIRTVVDEYGSKSIDEIKAVVEEAIEKAIRSKMMEIMEPMLSVFKSSDNTTIMVQLKVKGEDEKEIYDNAMKAREIALDTYKQYFPNVESYVSGGSVSKYELKSSGRKDVDVVQKTSVILTLLVLFIVLESLLAVLFPFLGIGAAIWVASGIVYLIATHVTDISSWARVLMLTTSLGLGIDYTTYYIHRYRELRRTGMEREEAAAEALRRARDGILASASTDIIGFAALLIAWDFPFVRTIGITVPIAIAMVFIASLTLIPAIVVLASRSKLFWWPKGLKIDKDLRESKLVSWVVKHKGIVLIVFILLLIPATISYVTFQGSHDITIYLPQGTQTEQAYLLMRDKIGASTLSPIIVVLSFDHKIGDSDLAVIEDISSKLSSIDHVSVVYSPTRPYGSPLENLTMDDVEVYNGTVYISKDNTTVMIRLLLDVPGESVEALNVVKEARSILKDYRGNRGIEEAYVGGMPAALVDLDELLDIYFWHRIIPASVVLMFVALALSLRGIIAAAITMATIYLGITGSLWLSSTLFTEFLGKPMLWFLPLVILVVLLGVGVDYNSFYIVRVRDEMEKRKKISEALSIAAGSSAKMIIGLALILASSYAGLLFTGMWAMKEMGFVLLTGVILIAVSAVYFLTPALIALVGERTFWPFKIGKEEKK